MTQRRYRSQSLMVAVMCVATTSQGFVWPTRTQAAEPEIRAQTIVIDIPGIRTQGENRPAQWGPVLIGSSDFERHNIRHNGALGGSTHRPESGTTTMLSHRWEASRDMPALRPVFADVQAGKSVYLKIDKNLDIGGYVLGKRSEEEWVRSVGNNLAEGFRQIAPGANIILNTHSSGTNDAYNLRLPLFNEVYFSSHRKSAAHLQLLVNRYDATKFKLIAGDRDFSHGLRRGLMSVTAPNLTAVNVKNGGLLPFTVHGNITNPSFAAAADLKSLGWTTRVKGSLGDILQFKTPASRLNPSIPVPSGTLGIVDGGCVRFPRDWGGSGGAMTLPGPLPTSYAPMGNYGGMGNFRGVPNIGGGFGGGCGNYGGGFRR